MFFIVGGLGGILRCGFSRECRAFGIDGALWYNTERLREREKKNGANPFRDNENGIRRG